MKSPMFEARVEGLQPRFYSERFPGCMVETGAFMFSLSLCICRALLIGGSIAVALERVSASGCKYFDEFRRRGSIDLTCLDPPLHKQAVHIDLILFSIHLIAIAAQGAFVFV